MSHNLAFAPPKCRGYGSKESNLAIQEGGEAFPIHQTTIHPHKILYIVEGHWNPPNWIPSSFPDDYPPPAPLLDQRLDEEAAAALEAAFTHNSVTYAVGDVPTGVVYEAFGDRYMIFLFTRMFHEDLEKNGAKSVFYGLDGGGYDILFKIMTCGPQQAIFASMYNFPARLRMSYRSSIPDRRTTRLPSQKDMECAFEAYLAVCVEYAGLHTTQEWFEKLVEPWLKGNVEIARKSQDGRDAVRMKKGESMSQSVKNRLTAYHFERVPATPALVGMLPYLEEPVIKVCTEFEADCRSTEACVGRFVDYEEARSVVRMRSGGQRRYSSWIRLDQDCKGYPAG